MKVIALKKPKLKSGQDEHAIRKADLLHDLHLSDDRSPELRVARVSDRGHLFASLPHPALWLSRGRSDVYDYIEQIHTQL